jgi:ubiquinone/menaquinone biosynthesis C-methylase UbiE
MCVDISKVWIETAQKRLEKHPHGTFHLGGISELDIPNASHDVIFVHFVMHDIAAGQRPHVVNHLQRR